MKEQRGHQSFNVGLKAFIAQGEKLLILQDQDGLWELPGGRIEKGEIFNGIGKIIRREVTEELGEDFQYDVGRIFRAWIRKPDGKDFCIFLVGVRCAYKEGEPKLSPEHQNFRWITKEDVDALDFENTYKDAIKKYFQRFEN